MAKSKNSHLKGFSLVEVLISVALFSIITLVIITSISNNIQNSSNADRKTKANLILESLYEGVYSLKSSNFVGLTEGTRGLTINANNKWELTDTPNTIDGYTRTVKIKNINNYEKEINLKVNWQSIQGATSEVLSTFRITKWNRLFYTFHDWSKPSITATVNLPGTYEGVELRTQGDYLYVARHGTTNNFCIIQVTDPFNPVLKKCINLPSTLNYVEVSGNYAILSSTSNSQELSIVNIIDPSNPFVERIVDLPGAGDAWGSRVVGNYLYVVTNSTNESRMYIIDFTIPANAIDISNISIPNKIIDISVYGNYAYLTTDSNTQEVVIADITNKLNPINIGSINLPGNGDGFVIHSNIENNRLIVSDTDGYVTIFNISNPLNPILQKDYLVNGRVGAMAVNYSSNYVFLATTNASREFQVLKITDPFNPTVFGFLNLPSAQYGLAYNSENDIVYVTGVGPDNEITIIKPSETIVDE